LLRVYLKTRELFVDAICAEVQHFVDKDPYAKNGLVTKFDIRPVNAVAGTWVTAAKSMSAVIASC
jgi:hypothetical protein